MITKVTVSDASRALSALEGARTEAGNKIRAALVNLTDADAAIASAIAHRDTMLDELSMAIDFRDKIDADAREIIRVAQEDNCEPYRR